MMHRQRRLLSSLINEQQSHRAPDQVEALSTIARGQSGQQLDQFELRQPP